MKTKPIPAIIMLLAGAIACVMGIVNHYGLFHFTVMLLIVLIIFYFLGCIVKIILDKNFKEMESAEDSEESEETEGEKENVESDDEEES